MAFVVRMDGHYVCWRNINIGVESVVSQSLQTQNDDKVLPKLTANLILTNLSCQRFDWMLQSSLSLILAVFF